MYNAGIAIRNIREEEFLTQSKPFEKIKFLLRYAVLAPSTHNSQPWLFKIEPPSCKIYYDPRYSIREADPLQRDLYISFGCFIENLVTAASYFGVYEHVQYICDQNTNLVAEVFFKNLSEVSIVRSGDLLLKPLIDAIKTRVNTRGVFEKKSIPLDAKDAFKKLNTFDGLELHLIDDTEKIKALALLTAEGLRVAYRSKKFREEMSGWINTSFSKRQEGIPGYSLRMPAPISLIFSSLVRWLDIGKRVGWLNYQSMASAPLVSIISVERNSPRIWLDVGRLGERMMLIARARGLKTSIFVASVEIGDLYKQVQTILETSRIPQFLMCVGFLNFDQKPNLRHSVEDKLI